LEPRRAEFAGKFNSLCDERVELEVESASCLTKLERLKIASDSKAAGGPPSVAAIQDYEKAVLLHKKVEQMIVSKKAEVQQAEGEYRILSEVIDTGRMPVLDPALPAVMLTVREAWGEEEGVSPFSFEATASPEDVQALVALALLKHQDLSRLIVSAPLDTEEFLGAWDAEICRPRPMPRDAVLHVRKTRRTGKKMANHEVSAWRHLLLSWNSLFPDNKVAMQEPSTKGRSVSAERSVADEQLRIQMDLNAALQARLDSLQKAFDNLSSASAAQQKSLDKLSETNDRLSQQMADYQLSVLGSPSPDHSFPTHMGPDWMQGQVPKAQKPAAAPVAPSKKKQGKAPAKVVVEVGGPGQVIPGKAFVPAQGGEKKALPLAPAAKKLATKKEAKPVLLAPAVPKPVARAPSSSMRKKGEPASKVLTEEQRCLLREVLELPPVTTEILARAGGPAERGALVSASAIPRWAVAAYLRDADKAVRDIRSGVLDKDTYAGWILSASKPTEPELKERWVSLREQFKGVSLLTNPRTVPEREYHAAWQSLRALEEKIGVRVSRDAKRRGPEKAKSQGGSELAQILARLEALEKRLTK
jgi:hypothetical protein